MKYAILIYSNPRSRAVWEAMPADERSVGLEVYEELNRDLAESGEMIAAEALDLPSEATIVTVRDGRTLTTDGPFAEVKEHLAGFYLIDCDSLDRAVEYAARIPEAAYGLVEVRRALGLDDLKGDAPA